MCSAENFGDNVTGRPVASARVEGLLVQPFRVEVEAHGSARSDDAVEDDLPEVPAALRHTALAVRADREPADRRAGVQERLDRLPAVRRVVLGIEPLDREGGVLALVPIEGVRPHPELEVEPASDGLIRDEPQHRQVAFSLLVRELRDADTGAGDVHQERVREIQVGIRDPPREVVAQPHHQVDTVEPLRDDHREVSPPERLVVEPRLVVELAREQPSHAAHRVRGALDDRLVELDRLERVVPVLYPVRELEHRVDEPTDV